MFNCDCCGQCCMNIGTSALYRDLDRGDGICRFFNTQNHLCTIYDNRPTKCNVDASYNLYFKKSMTKEKYYQLNYDACKKLKAKSNKQNELLKY